MDPISFPKGYLLSSTPVQSSEDSGYFGSGQRRYKSSVNILNSCSPVQESSFKNASENFPFYHELCGISPRPKFNNDFHVDSESLHGSEINESSELEFINSDSSYQNELRKTCPSISKTKQKLLDIHYNSSDTNSIGFFSSASADQDIKYKLFEHEPSDLITDDFDCLKNSNELATSREYASVKNWITFKQTKIDFIHELKIRNCLSLITHLLSYLSAKELCIVSCVSKEWNKVVLDDYKANLRRENFIAERVLFLNGPAKENRLGMRFGPSREHKNAFSDLTNINTAVNLLPANVKAMNTRFESFIKEGKNGKKLLKCPKCGYASKYVDGSYSVCTHCSYRFCSHCLNPTLKNHTCFKQELPNILVGSKKSKKNLRRLTVL